MTSHIVYAPLSVAMGNTETVLTVHACRFCMLKISYGFIQLLNVVVFLAQCQTALIWMRFKVYVTSHPDQNCLHDYATLTSVKINSGRFFRRHILLICLPLFRDIENKQVFV